VVPGDFLWLPHSRYLSVNFALNPVGFRETFISCMSNKKTTIALIDDHVLFREGLARIINSFGAFEVIGAAGNGRLYTEAGLSPDIVITDISMPEMNGFETLEWIREHQPGTRVLVLSMVESEEAVIQLLKTGAHGYLSKGTEPGTLQQCLEEIRDNGFAVHAYRFSSLRGDAVVLTAGERAFVALACSEMTYREIAEKLHISPRNVDSYRNQLFRKLNVNSRIGLVLYAVRNGIIMV